MDVLNARQRRELLLVLVLSAIVVAAAVGADRFNLVSGNRAAVLYDKHYTAARAPFNTTDLFEGGWNATSDGLRLAPGQSGSVTIRVQNDREGRVVMNLLGRGGQGLHWRIFVSGDGAVFREAARGNAFDGGRRELTASGARFDTIWIKVAATVDASARQAEPAVLSQMRVVALKPPLIYPNLPLAFLLVLTPALAYVMRVSLRPTGALPFSLLVLCGLAILTEAIARTHMAHEPMLWWERAVASQEYNDYFVIPYGLLLALWWWRAQRDTLFETQQKPWLFFALLGILAWGGSTRLGALVEWGWARTNPDAVWYMQLAKEMSSLYDTGYREPFWIWLLKGWFWVTGGATLMHQRLLTVVLSVVLLGVAYKLFRDYTGQPLVGLLVAGLLCANPYLISLSTQGMREEAYLIAVLCVVYFVCVPNMKLSVRGQAIGLALSGAAVQLLRFNSYVFLALLLLVWAWRQAPGKWHYVALPVAFIAVVSVPHLVHNYRESGDPMLSVNVHYVWVRNHEFVNFKKIGCDGCPSQEELLVNCCGGPKVGLYGYLFGMHSVQEIVERTARGYRDMYLKPTVLFAIQSGTQSYLCYILYLVGLGAIVLFGPYREMLAMIVLLANGIPFVATFDVDPRLGIQTAPFVAFILAYGIWWSLAQVLRCRALLRGPSSALCEMGSVFRSGVR